MTKQDFAHDKYAANTVNEIETKEFFNSIASSWDNMCHAHEDFIDEILTQAKVPVRCKILDVACGTGILFKPLLRRNPTLLRAIDISDNMVAIAQKKNSNSNVIISLANFYKFEETGFDCIVVYNAYPHFFNKHLFSKTACNCLKKDGRLVIAHGCGRSWLNERHNRDIVSTLSEPLLPCEKEISRLGNCFTFDVMVDTDSKYILSGIKK